MSNHNSKTTRPDSNSTGRIRLIKRLIIIYTKLIQDILSLFWLEFILAKKNIGPLIISIVFLLIFGLNSWLVILSLIFGILFFISHNWLLSLFLATGLDIIAVGICLWLVTKYFRRIRFTYSRKRLKKWLLSQAKSTTNTNQTTTANIYASNKTKSQE